MKNLFIAILMGTLIITAGCGGSKAIVDPTMASTDKPAAEAAKAAPEDIKSAIPAQDQAATTEAAATAPAAAEAKPAAEPLPSEEVKTTDTTASAQAAQAAPAQPPAPPAAPAATEAAKPKAAAAAINVPEFADVNFDFNMYDIKEQYRKQLFELSNWLIEHNNVVVMIEGHCDDRGTNEYNLALGDRRASSIQHFLLASGVPHTKIETASYGEERPLCTEKTEPCWARNRRAHFQIEVGR